MAERSSPTEIAWAAPTKPIAPARPETKRPSNPPHDKSSNVNAKIPIHAQNLCCLTAAIAKIVAPAVTYQVAGVPSADGSRFRLTRIGTTKDVTVTKIARAIGIFSSRL